MQIINYLQQDIYISILNDIKQIANYHNSNKFRKKGGFFSIPREVFCYVDFLSRIAYGNSSTRNAIEFIKKYFTKEYYTIADLIYVMWRHGLVHEYSPKRIFCKDKRLSIVGISWRSDNSASARNRKDHLRIVERQGNRDLYLSINICQLVDDLLIAVNNFIKALNSDHSFADRCDKNLYFIQGIRSCEELKIPKEIKDNIETQIIKCWKSRSAKIDEKGNIIKRSKTLK